MTPRSSDHDGDRIARSGRRRCCCPPDGPSPLYVVLTVGLHGVSGSLVCLASFIYASDAKCSDDMTLFGPLQLLWSSFFIAYAVHLYRVFAVPYETRVERFRSSLNRGGLGAPSSRHYQGQESDGPFERLTYVFLVRVGRTRTRPAPGVRRARIA